MNILHGWLEEFRHAFHPEDRTTGTCESLMLHGKGRGRSLKSEPGAMMPRSWTTADNPLKFIEHVEIVRALAGSQLFSGSLAQATYQRVGRASRSLRAPWTRVCKDLPGGCTMVWVLLRDGDAGPHVV